MIALNFIDIFVLLPIIARSLAITIGGVLLAVIVAVPFAVLFVGRNGGGARMVITLAHALMAMPPVVIGLVLYVLFRPAGLFGGADLLYTLTIMTMAQMILALPIIFALSYESLLPIARRFAIVFASYPDAPWLRARMLMREGRFGIATAIAAGFGRALAEVGAVLIVGGNIQGLTQVMTTLIVQDTQQGRLDRALGAGLVLFLLAMMLAMLGHFWRARSERLRNG